ncbi:MAG: tetratricopeptide repeat protein, partial [Aestuariivirga sp.]|nr:tetratricopeptide repeat protein [Aestuariivirga sp.]
GWLFVASSIPILLHFLMGARGLRKEQSDVENFKASLENIGARFKNGELTDAEADAARLALLSRLPSSRWGFSKNIQGYPLKLLVTSAVFLLVSGIGAAVSYDKSAPETMRPEEMISFSEPDGELLTQLTDYVRSIGTEQPSSMATTGELLPDVNAMIERLAARLEAKPRDVEGWRMLGWSYFHTERYEQAATAFGKALELDPGSAELKRSYEEAKAKASESGNLQIASSLQTEVMDGKPSVGKVTTPEAMPEPERDAAIRSMVNGLAQRLESSPRDVDGWIHLMRSRVVLGETEVAATAFQKALEVFVEDPAASGKIMAAAIEFGLKTE